MQRNLVRLWVILCLNYFFSTTVLQAEEYRSSSIFFPEVTYFDNFNRADVTKAKDSTVSPVITIVHAGKYKSLSTLMEFSANRNHQRIERLQLGWDYSDFHNVKIGRGHTPAGFWNTEYHHGTYLQTSLSRPSPTLTYWPRHITGLQFDGEFKNYITYDFLMGLGSDIEHGGIEDFDIVDPSGDHKFSYTGNLSFRPIKMNETKIGISFSFFDMSSPESDHDQFEQYLTSIYANWIFGKNRIITEWFYSSTDIPDSDVTGDNDFITGYVQYERIINPKFTAYGRIEDSFGEDDAKLLKIISGYKTNVTLIGLRYDVTDNQAITIEASTIDKLNDKYNTIAIKWNAAFPW